MKQEETIKSTELLIFDDVKQWLDFEKMFEILIKRSR